MGEIKIPAKAFARAGYADLRFPVGVSCENLGFFAGKCVGYRTTVCPPMGYLPQKTKKPPRLRSGFESCESWHSSFTDFEWT
jgi:hypothetical protein